MFKFLKRLSIVSLILISSLLIYDKYKQYTSPTYTIYVDLGGLIGPYMTKYELLLKSKINIKVSGLCVSACTLAFSIYKEDPEKICVVEGSVLGFHAPRRARQDDKVETSEEATNWMLNSYPKKIQNWINENGGLKAEMIYLKGEDLKKVVNIC